MATITGLTAAAMQEIRDGAYVAVELSVDNLIFTKHDGTTVNVGSVRGPQGEPGAPGADGTDGVDGTTTVPTGVFPPTAYSVHTAVSTALTTGGAVIPLDTERFHVANGNAWSLNAGAIVIPDAGVYHIDIKVSINTAATLQVELLDVTTSGILMQCIGASAVASGSGLLQCTAGQKIELFGIPSGATTVATDSKITYVDMHRVA